MPDLSDLTAPVAPTALPALSTPPTMTDPANFADRADQHVAEVVAQVPLQNAANANVHHNAQSAYVAAQVAVPAAELSVAARDQAQAHALTAINAPGTWATSSSNLALVTGLATITLDQVGKLFAKGQNVTVARTSNPVVQAPAIITNFVPGTGVMTFALGEPTAAGTYSDWTISIAPPPGSFVRLTYDNRATLRGVSAMPGGAAMVDGLGMFLHAAGSTELDDDETCFATGTGRWLLVAANLEVVNGWLQPLLDQCNVGSVNGSMLSAITSINAVTSATLTAPAAGAAPGDRVIVTPPGALQAWGTFYGFVPALDTVSIVIANSHGSTTLTTNVAGTWRFTVLKELT